MPLARPARLWAAALLLAVPGVADADFIYYSTAGELPIGGPDSTIKRANADGSGVVTILTPPASGRYGGIALDAANGHLYSGDGSFLFRANLDGTGRVNLAPSGGGTADVELDLAHGKVYWGIIGAKVFRANLDGGGVEVLVNSGSGTIEGLALDPAAGKLYWANNVGGSEGIGVANLDGTGAAVFRSLPNGSNPFDVETDPAGGKLYWNENGPSRAVRRANLDGSGVIELVYTAVDTSGNGISFDPLHQQLYSSERRVGNSVPVDLVRYNTDGTGRQVLLTDFDRINYIAVLPTAAVPEPTSVLLAGAGAVGLIVARRRTLRRATPA